ncbi:MAG: TonB C-terminal domain-containing protein [Gammaproteobacteria bacterium]
MKPLGWSLVGHGVVGLLVLVAARLHVETRPVPAPTVAPIQTVLVDARTLRQRPASRSAVPPPTVPTPVAEPPPPERPSVQPSPRPSQAQSSPRRTPVTSREPPTARPAQAVATTPPPVAAADTARNRLAAEAALEAQLLAEAAPAVAPVDGALEEWNQRLRERIEAKWYRPASARRGLRCRVSVTLVPGGTVVSVMVEECNGDATVRESLRSAVMNASPLPMPREPRQFQRKIVLEFTPDD